ncbi:hypothetical protein [Hymenobacter jeollabukensis]|uniref:Uncharacterized protein n=1 Tax=Hymenobacter jeollabukensis TaxID=2025313 RepID=A0A5R8WQI5_9BACT|nr:hypothetical protein FDY95_10225 [Hymenobacter jeollabukensis]
MRRLFAAYDGKGTAMLARSAGVLSAFGVATLLPAPFGAPGLKQTIAGVGLLSGSVGAVLGLSRMVRFSARHRDEVLAAYQQGEPLPRYVRRRLRPEHFQPGGQRASAL